MKIPVFIVMFVALSEAQVSQRANTSILTSNNGDPWGTWRNISFCPEGSWANGFMVKHEPNVLFFDDTALNGIRLICSNAEGTYTGAAESFSEQFGDWKPVGNCSGNGYLEGFKLQVEKPQGNGDDTGANGVEFGCSNNNDTVIFNGQYGTWGTYTACPANSAICGIQNKVEAYGGVRNDDTSVDDIKLFCCSLFVNNVGAQNTFG